MEIQVPRSTGYFISPWFYTVGGEGKSRIEATSMRVQGCSEFGFDLYLGEKVEYHAAGVEWGRVAVYTEEAHEESESQWYESSSNGLRVMSMLVGGDCQARVERLMLRSGIEGGPAGVGEYERGPPMMSTSCS